MTINITLFVQIIHFCIALFILRRFFWRPVNGLIESEQERQNTLTRQIKTAQKKSAERESTLQSMWHNARAAFAESTPDITMPRLSLREEQYDGPESANDAVIRKALAPIAHEIVRQVINDS